MANGKVFRQIQFYPLVAAISNNPPSQIGHSLSVFQEVQAASSQPLSELKHYAFDYEVLDYI